MAMTGGADGGLTGGESGGLPERGSQSGPVTGAAFLVAQVGAHAARRFAELVAELELDPPQAGLLRAIAGEPGRSQQALATQLGTPATRLVSLVDGLEQRGLIERRRKIEDRRHYALYLTADGRRLLRSLGGLARRHDDQLLAALDQDERRQLRELLARVAAEQGLAPGVHPGYRSQPDLGDSVPAVVEATPTSGT